MKLTVGDPGRWETVKSALGSWAMTWRLVLILIAQAAVAAVVAIAIVVSRR